MTRFRLIITLHGFLVIAEPLVENYDTHLHDTTLQTIDEQNLLRHMLFIPLLGKCYMNIFKLTVLLLTLLD